ncbi:MAG: DNA primase [Chitinispirillaceae bacterium]
MTIHMNQRFDDTVKEDIRARADIALIVGRYVNLKPQGQTLKGLCPFHKEKTPSFNVNPARGFYHCFGCGKGGDVFSFLQEIEGVDFPEALRMLAQETGVRLETRHEEASDAGNPAKVSKTELIDIHKEASLFYYHQIKAFPKTVEYFKSRGLSAETVKEFQLGYAPPGWSELIDYMRAKNIAQSELVECGLAVQKENGRVYDRFRDRIIFPLYDLTGRVIAFAGRGLEADAKPKYLNSPETALYQKNRVLYGIHKARQGIREQKRILVVEGYMDYLSLYQAGIRNAVATSGTAFTVEHAHLIRRFTSRVVLVFDGDQAGLGAAQKALQVLAPFNLEVSVLVLPQGEDPDSFVKAQGADAFLGMLDSAQNSTSFLIEKAVSEHDSDSPHGKRQVIEELAAYVEQLKDPIIRDDFITKLSDRLRVDKRLVFKRFRSGGREQEPQRIASITVKESEKYLSGLEGSFLRILMTSPELVQQASQYVSPETLTDKLSSDIYSLILRTYEEKGSLEGLTEGLREESEVKRVIHMMMVRPALRDHIHEELVQKIILLRRKFLKNQLRNLRVELRSAPGDKQRLLELHREYTVQLKELEEQT